MFEVIKSGGILMIPIFACGIIATFIIIERMLYYRSVSKGEKGLLDRVRVLIKKREYDAAEAECSASDSPLGRLVLKALDYRTYSDSAIKEAVMNESNVEVPKLERFLSPLGTIANISTLLGLLGTVTGNIQAFGVLGGMGAMGNPAVLAGAIAEALVTTAAGLFVAIPSLIFYNYFVGRVNRMITRMESSVNDIVILLNGRERIV